MIGIARLHLALIGLCVGLALFGGHALLAERSRQAAYDNGYAAAQAEFEAAQAKADQAAQANVIARQAKQAVIGKEKSDALHSATVDIDVRARALSVRHDEAAASRAPGNLPGTRDVAAGAGQAPACDGLAWSAALPLMVQAAKNDAQLNAILDFEEAQDALEVEQ